MHDPLGNLVNSLEKDLAKELLEKKMNAFSGAEGGYKCPFLHASGEKIKDLTKIEDLLCLQDLGNVDQQWSDALTEAKGVFESSTKSNDQTLKTLQSQRNMVHKFTEGKILIMNAVWG